MAKKFNVIEVSFTKDENDLYYRIRMRCKYMKMACWLKEAAYEKLEREDHPEMFMDNNTVSHQMPVYQQQQEQIVSKMPVTQDGLFSMLNMIQ